MLMKLTPDILRHDLNCRLAESGRNVKISKRNSDFLFTYSFFTSSTCYHQLRHLSQIVMLQKEMVQK